MSQFSMYLKRRLFVTLFLVSAACQVQAGGCLSAKEIYEPGYPVLLISGGFCHDQDLRGIGNAIRLGSHDEVWLDSPGGSVGKGFELGRLLRLNGQFVRVASGRNVLKGRDRYCVSSCTIAFLGGILRDVDEDADFRVHIYSAHSMLKDDEGNKLATLRFWEQFQEEKDRAGTLRSIAKQGNQRSFNSAKKIVLYAYEMFNGRSNVRALVNGIHAAEPYPSMRDLSVDLADISEDGLVAFQRILMEIERQAAQHLHDSLQRRLHGGDVRLKAAVRYLDRMLSSRIDGTARLSRQQLRQLGYINVVSELRH